MANVGRNLALSALQGWTPPAGVSPVAAQAMAQLMGVAGPLNIISAYRDPARNAKVGGAKKSQHMHGNAFDVDVKDLPREERLNLIRQAQEAGFQGIGVYDNSLHFDVGPARAWGPDYSRNSLPDWAAPAIGGGAPAPTIVDAAVNAGVPPSILDQRLPPQSNSPVTLADEEPKQGIAKFADRFGLDYKGHGNALQSLGAAIAAGSQGLSSADAMSDIRDAYFQEQQAAYEKQAAEQQRIAAISIVGGPDTPLGRALADGADVEQVLTVYANERALQQDESQFSRGLASEESQFGRGLVREDQRIGLEADRVDLDKGRLAIEQGMFGIAKDENSREAQRAQDERDLATSEMISNAARGEAMREAIAKRLEATDPEAANEVRRMLPATFDDPQINANLMDILFGENADPSDLADFIENYSAYKELLPVDPAGAQLLKDSLLTPKGGTTINNNLGGDKFGEEFGKLDAKQLSDMSVVGANASRNLARIDQLEGFLKTAPQGLVGGAKAYAGEWGIPTEGLSDIQAAMAMINSLVPEQRPPGTGPMSDQDLLLFKQSVPRIINQPGGNELILRTMRGLSEYDRAGAEIVQRLRGGEIDRATAFKQLMERPDPLASFRQANSANTTTAAPAATDSDGWTEVDGVRIREKR